MTSDERHGVPNHRQLEYLFIIFAICGGNSQFEQNFKKKYLKFYKIKVEHFDIIGAMLFRQQMLTYVLFSLQLEIHPNEILFQENI